MPAGVTMRVGMQNPYIFESTLEFSQIEVHGILLE
jgi:hypothetical protein